MNSCADNRYIKVVYSGVSSGLFIKGKCCGNEVISSLSLEMSKLTYFTGAESTANQKWNVECERLSLITGVLTSVCVLFYSMVPFTLLNFNFKLRFYKSEYFKSTYITSSADQALFLFSTVLKIIPGLSLPKNVTGFEDRI